ncbi:FtsK/SpoIIIE domain-containing protein [Streptomyces sp. NPDC051664]|uniref:FtsK/SpoIIIE domain-containing protein n=1 Tax=Streptomyces sp. NPDC051664 TaxID=3365668 RepID=UPI0037AE67A7
MKTGWDMGKKQQHKPNSEEMYGQLAGAIGGLAIVFGILAAIKDKLGLSWPATMVLVVGVLVGLGYGAWKLRGTLRRLVTGETQPATALKQEAPGQAAGVPETAVEAPPAHPELTEALITAGVIDKAEVIRADEVDVEPVSTGKRYNFLLPKTRTYQDVEKRLENVAGWFGVSRLHVKLERSRDNERRVHLLMLDQAPFAQTFPAPTRREIETFAGVPIGHDVTGQLAGVPTFDKASMLIGGMTQMGKTTLVNGIITCLLIAYGDFDLYLLDGKICGLITFEKACVRYEASDQPAVFESMVDELYPRVEARYKEKQEAKRNRQPEPKFRPVIFIVDEVADFFADDGTPKGKEHAARIEEKARKLVAKSLESGISVIMLTQRPDKDAVPVKVRNQFQYRMCMYVESAGTAKVTLGDSYFDTAAPISPTHLNPDIKGQGVLFAGGTSTLLRGFDFEEEFMWEVVDEVADRQQKKLEAAPVSPLKQAIDLMRNKGVDFMPTPELAPTLGIAETNPVEAGKKLNLLLGVPAYRGAKGVRGYRLADLTAAAMSGS